MLVVLTDGLFAYYFGAVLSCTVTTTTYFHGLFFVAVFFWGTFQKYKSI